MSKSTSYTLGDHFDTYVKAKITSGRYKTASEVIREGLRRMEEDDRKLDALRHELAIGEQQIADGECADYSYAALMEKLDTLHHAKA